MVRKERNKSLNNNQPYPYANTLYGDIENSFLRGSTLSVKTGAEFSGNNDGGVTSYYSSLAQSIKDPEPTNNLHLDGRIKALEDEKEISTLRLNEAFQRLDEADGTIRKMCEELKDMKKQLSESGNYESNDDDSSTAHLGSLNDDTFGLMKIRPILSQSWMFSFFIYIIQTLLLIMVFSQQLKSGNGGAFVDIPFQVTPFTRLAQCMAIFMTIAISRDIFIPVKEIPNLWVTNKEEWLKIVRVSENEATCTLWMGRIFLPSFMQFMIGALAMIVSFFIIIQSNDVINIFGDFAAMGVISECDNIAFWFAQNGYLGDKIRKDADDTTRVTFKDKTRKLCCFRFLGIRSLFFLVLFILMNGAFIFVAHRQDNGFYYQQKYPACALDVSEMHKLGDGFCDGGIVNTYQCGFDDGDCIKFNIAFPDCGAIFPEEVGDGKCNNEYDKIACGYDGGDCCSKIDDPHFGDGICHAGFLHSSKCLYDRGDCDILRHEYPNCPDYEGEDIVDENGQAIEIGNGICDFGKEYIEQYMNEDCGWVFGDCLEVRDIDLSKREKYPNCKIEKDFFKIGDGKCDNGDYLSEECGWDEFDCCVLDITKINDTICDSNNLSDKETSYLTKECGFEGLDCCDKDLKSIIRKDGTCFSGANKIECGWDRGDCNEFNEDFKDCKIDDLTLLGNGFCNGGSYNTNECNWDAKDCYYCYVGDPTLLANGICNGGAYNKEECSWDGGDCIEFNTKYPKCIVEYPSVVGDGKCDGEDYNTTPCGWDGGDCS